MSKLKKTETKVTKVEAEGAPLKPSWLREMEGDPLGQMFDAAVSLFDGSFFEEADGAAARVEALTEGTDSDGGHESPSRREAAKPTTVTIEHIFSPAAPKRHKSKPVESADVGTAGTAAPEAPPAEGE